MIKLFFIFYKNRNKIHDIFGQAQVFLLAENLMVELFFSDKKDAEWIFTHFLKNSMFSTNFHEDEFQSSFLKKIFRKVLLGYLIHFNCNLDHKICLCYVRGKL
jgi:hypothetical protein